jgi:RNA polymerase sigma-70 factor, ECF subfamily
MRPEIGEAVRLIQRKDQKSLEDALALLQGTVYSFSMKVCGQREDAEATMQEVPVKSVPNLPKFDRPRALMVWRYKVAKSRCLMSRRKSKFAPKEALSLEELMSDRQESQQLSGKSVGTPETSLLRRENAKRLRKAVQKLPPEYRLILVFHDMEDLSDADIAEITGLRGGTIRVRPHRARLFVRRELAKQDGPQVSHGIAKASAETHAWVLPRPGRCKEMFARLSSYSVTNFATLHLSR